MINAFEIANFKAFGDEPQAIPLIHGAHRGLASRFMWKARCAVPDLAKRLDGQRTGLHRNFGAPDSKDWELLFEGMSEVALSLTVGIPRDDKGNTARSATPRVERLQCLIDDQVLFSAFAVGDKLLKIDQLAADHLIIERLVETLAMIETFTVDVSDRVQEYALGEIDKLVPRLAMQTDGFMPKLLFDKLKTPYQLKMRDYYTLNNLESAYSDSLYDAIYEVIATLHEEIDESWLWDLQEAAKAKDEAQRACFDEGKISEEVMVSRTDPFYRMIDEFLENHTNIDVDAWAWKKRAEQKTKPSSSDLILEDQRTRTEVSHRDVGIGISQVLPVLVTAYASKGQILAIEQPEIHLHPALQAELADVFVESAMGESGNRFLLETRGVDRSSGACGAFPFNGVGCRRGSGESHVGAAGQCSSL